MVAASDMKTAGEQTMEEGRKGFLTVRNVLLAFSVLGGAVSFLSAFSPSMPIDWSVTVKNLLTGYQAVFRDPVHRFIESLGIQFPKIGADIVVFYSVFVIPTLWQTITFALRQRSWLVVGLVATPAMMVVADYIWSNGNAAFSTVPFIYYFGLKFPPGIAGLSLLIGLVLLVAPMNAANRIENGFAFLISVYGKVFAVVLVVALILFANRVFFGYGY